MILDGPVHTEVPVLADRQELIDINFVWTYDVFWKAYRDRWTMGTNGKSGKSVQAVRLDDNLYVHTDM